MLCTSTGQNVFEMSSVSQCQVDQSIKSATLSGKMVSCGRHVMIRPVEGEDSQKSPQIDVSRPFPIRFRRPLEKPARAATILRHVKEARSPTSAVKKDPRGKYLAFIIRDKSRSRAVTNRHACFANIARLKHSRSQKPILPSSFERHIRVHESHCSPPELPSPDQN